MRLVALKKVPIIGFGIVLLGLLILLNLQMQRANAITLNPDPGNIWGPARTYLESADSQPQSPTVAVWTALQSDPQSTNVTVPHGTASISLRFWGGATVGWSPSSTTVTRWYVGDASAGVQNLVGDHFDLNLSPNQNVPGATVVGSVGYAYAPAGGFTASGSHTITIRAKVISIVNGVHHCVINGSTAPTSLTDYSACPYNDVSFGIWVSVPPPDECSNIPGNQSAIPADHYKSGSQCLPHRYWEYEHDSFNVNRGAKDLGDTPYASVKPGWDIDVSNNIENTGDGSGTDYRHRLQVRVDSGSWSNILDEDENGLGSGSDRSNSETYTIPSGTAHGTRICFRGVINPFSGRSTPSPTSSSSGARGSGQKCVRVQRVDLTCGTNGVTFDVSSPIRAGEAFKTYVHVDNTNDFTVVVNSVVSRVRRANNTAPPGSNITTTYNPAANLAANDTDATAEYWTSNGNEIRINEPGTFTVSWQINSEFNTLTCSETIVTTVEMPTCNASTVTSAVLGSTTISISVTNPNLIPMPVTNATYNIPDLGLSGSTSPSTGTVPAGGSQAFSADIGTIPNAGVYQVNWVVYTSFGDCPDDSELYIVNQPYYRAYGNDIVTCGTGDVLQSRPGSPVNAFNQYRGGAAQLAIFATGQIEGVLPGAMDTRGAGQLHELGFSNTANVSLAAGQYGGAFASCYAGLDQPINAEATPLTSSNLGSGAIGSGEYYSSGNVSNLRGNIPNGRRVVVYVDGDVDVRDIEYADTSWSTLDEIPQVTVIASGNIYIHHNTTTLDGHYVAQGDIFTCAGTGSNTNLTGANSSAARRAFLINNCDNKLTINGSLKANHIHFLRINGTLADGDTFEQHDSGNIAEVIRFSPEAYLTEGGGLTPLPQSNPSIDSIVGRPPTF